MKKYYQLISLLFPYKGFIFLNVLFNLIASFFSLFSLTMLIPFLSLLFGNQTLVTEPMPFELTADYALHTFNYQLSKVIIDYGPSKALMVIIGMVFVLSLVKTSTQFLANYFITPVRTGTIRDLRNMMYSKILNLPVSYFNDSRKGDIISRMSTDAQEIEASLMSTLEMMFRDPIQITIYLGFMFVSSSHLTLFVLLLLPISGLIIGRLAKTLRSSSLRGQMKLGIIVSNLEETLSGIRVIKVFNAESKMQKRFENTNTLFTMILNKVFRRRYLASPISEFLGILTLLMLMWYGGSMVLGDNNAISPAHFIAYIAIFSQVINPAKSFSNAFFSIQKGLASLDRINDVLHSDEKIYESPNPLPIKSFEEKIEFKNINFRYDRDEVLKDVSLSVNKGKTVAIVGKSGSGKSTLIDLLPRLMDPQSGDIFIDGQSIKDYKISDIRNLMGVVGQQSILFNDSFFNNIAFGNDQATIEDVMHAAKIAHAHDFIIETPNGYYTNIGESGGKLSGGQKQRISIARAVLKNPPILILDEATSALDTESERFVQEAIINLMKNRTSVVIAHRLSTIQHADEIIVMDEGKIVERGTHEDLVNNKGVYHKLYQLQLI